MIFFLFHLIIANAAAQITYSQRLNTLDLWTVHRVCDVSDYYVAGTSFDRQDNIYCIGPGQPLIRADLISIKNKSVIGVLTSNLFFFMENWHPLLRNQSVVYTLVSFDSDISITNFEVINEGLRRGHIIEWFATNPSDAFVHDDDMRHRRHGLLLGIPKYYEAVEEFSQVYTSLNVIPSREQWRISEKDYELAVAFSPSTNAGRRAVQDFFCSKQHLATCRIGLNRTEYYRFLTRSRFVLSPRGTGIDCYRNYESLMLGSIPIIERSSLESVYSSLPVLIVDNFMRDISKPLLDNFWQSFVNATFQSSSKWKWQQLTASYWKWRFRNHSFLRREDE